MKLIAAHHAAPEQMEAFLQMNRHVEKELLLREGYVVIIGDKIRGCFVLSTVEAGVFWLKQLYIVQEAAASLPILLETIVAMAREKQGKRIYVHSHQPLVDLLLEALQFHREKEKMLFHRNEDRRGNWWTYDVS